MAIEMLVEETSNRVPHAYYHDLESVFYSLCWVCTSQEGPNSNPRCSCFNFSTAEVSKWNGVGMDNPTLDDIQTRKFSSIHNKTKFSKLVLNQFAKYFESLVPCIAALKEVMVGENSNIDDINPYYREEIEATRRKLDEARREGKPLDKTLLKSIPIFERDYRDVFRSIYEIIDKCIHDLKEPDLEPCKCSKKAAKRKKPTREEIDNNNPKGVRDLIDKNADDMAFRVEAVAEQKERERDANGGIDPATIPHSGIVLLQRHSHPGPDESQLDESDDPSSKIGRRIAGEAGMTSSRPNKVSFRLAPQQTKSLDSGSSTLLPSPLIRRRSDRIRKSTGSGNMPPPPTPGRAKHRSSNEHSKPPASLIGRHSPPPSSGWASSSKRSASEFEDDESGQKTPTQMSSPKKQRRR